MLMVPLQYWIYRQARGREIGEAGDRRGWAKHQSLVRDGQVHNQQGRELLKQRNEYSGALISCAICGIQEALKRLVRKLLCCRTLKRIHLLFSPRKPREIGDIEPSRTSPNCMISRSGETTLISAVSPIRLTLYIANTQSNALVSTECSKTKRHKGVLRNLVLNDRPILKTKT
jgi:ribosomal protein S14